MHRRPRWFTPAVRSRTLGTGLAALLLAAGPSLAGPCTADIAAAQAEVDARIEAVAGAGPMGGQSVGAQLHRQPTPGSMAGAEARLGEGTAGEQAVAALARARVADAAGDAAGCRQALADARRAVGP